METVEKQPENQGKNDVKSTLVSRNITIQGRRTSIRLEPEMWSSLCEIAKREQCSSHDICALVSLRKKENTSLTAAIRVFIMLYFRAASTEDGHRRVGHGNFNHMKARAGLSKPNETRAFWHPAGPGASKRAVPSFVSDVGDVSVQEGSARTQM